MSRSIFEKATPAQIKKRMKDAEVMLVELPKMYHAKIRELLPVWLQYRPLTWRTLFELVTTAEEDAHKKRMDALKAIMDVKRKACKHENTHYEPDPSGNHDSTTECLDCGKIL